METRLPFTIRPQPDGSTCGPTCLQSVYEYYGDDIPLEQVVKEVPSVEGGGTLAVFLALHALRRGFKATIYTYKLQLFDPTWFASGKFDLGAKLKEQMKAKEDAKLRAASGAYLGFLELGGTVRFDDLTPGLIRKYLKCAIPIITGLSATCLYRTPREFGPHSELDDVRGDPSGHFVVLCGYDGKTRSVLVADPLLPNPVSPNSTYAVPIERVICAILLGVLTYDGDLLIIQGSSRLRGR